MSLDLARSVITRLEPGDRLAHTEYCSNYALCRAVTGRDPRTDGDAWRAFNDAWDVDFIWSTNDGPVGWEKRGRTTDMGHAEFLEGGVDRRDEIFCPFNTVEEVWAFDAVKEYGLPDADELTASYAQSYTTTQERHTNQLFPGGYYKTMISGAIQAFGWDMLLLAAADRSKFDRVIDSFFRLTRHHVEAWARTDIEVFIQHDDIVWTAGAFVHPDFYREVLMPRYAEMWRILHDAGKTVLFCSDGDMTEFIDDIADAGADGFIYEPMTDFDYMVEKYGDSKVIVGSKVDCRTLTFGTQEDIQREIEATLDVAFDCPGFVFAVGNHLPSNIPVENGLFYMEYLRERWAR